MRGGGEGGPAGALDRPPAADSAAAQARAGREGFGAARQRYLALAARDPEGASAYALSVLPRFAGHPFFYMRLFRSGDERAARAAAERAVEAAAASEDVPLRVLAQAIALLVGSGAAPATLGAAREVHDRKSVEEGEGHLALARAARRERRARDAYDHIEAHLQGNADDRQGIIARGVLAWRSGRWGERMDAIEAMRPHSGNRRAAEILQRIDGFLAASGTTGAAVLRQPPAVRAALQSPASVYELACGAAPPPSPGGRHGTVVMIPTLGVGGAERIAAHVHRALRDRGEAVQLWLHAGTDRKGGDGLFYLPLAGADEVQVVPPVEPARPPLTWLPRAMGGRAQAIHDRLTRVRPRAVHLSLDGPMLAGGLAAVLAGVPRIVLHGHNMWPARLFTGENSTFGWARAYRALLLRPEVSLVAVGRTVAEDYLARIGPDLAPKVSVVRNGFDFPRLEEACDPAGLRGELGIPAGAPVVGSAFRFEEVKRPELWLDMAALVHRARPEAHFVLFGDGLLLPRAREYAAELGLRGHVHFPGNARDLYRRLPLLDVFVLASRSEGLPNVLVEAQAAGAVPVAFDVGGCGETLVDGVTGRLVASETAEALAGAVAAVLADDAWRRAAREEGRRFVRSAFSLEAMTTRIAELLSPAP